MKGGNALGGHFGYAGGVSKLTWPAAERNKQPILKELQRLLPPRGTLLELASGTGQHACYFAEHLAQWTIQPSDVDAVNLASIDAWRSEAGLSNLRSPLCIDVCSDDWGIAPVEAIYNANMVHIAPWDVALGLLRGAARHLQPGGTLVVYGPFRLGGEHTAPSNQAFDDSLKAKDSRFGVRDLEAVLDVAKEQGFRLRERVEMPANNQLLALTSSS